MGYTLKEMCQKSAKIRTRQSQDLCLYGKEIKGTVGYNLREAELALLDAKIEILLFLFKERSN